VTYDENVLTATGVYRSNYSNSMTLVPNLSVPGALSFVLFDFTPLSGTGEVAWIVFHAVGATGTSSSLTMTQHDLNEGLIPSVAHNGVVNVLSRDVVFSMPDNASGAAGSTVSVPITVNPS